MVLRHGTASGHGKVVEILAIVMVLLYMLTRMLQVLCPLIFSNKNGTNIV